MGGSKAFAGQYISYIALLQGQYLNIVLEPGQYLDIAQEGGFQPAFDQTFLIYGIIYPLIFRVLQWKLHSLYSGSCNFYLWY